MRVHSAVLSLFPFDYSESTSFPPPNFSLTHPHPSAVHVSTSRMPLAAGCLCNAGACHDLCGFDAADFGEMVKQGYACGSVNDMLVRARDVRPAAHPHLHRQEGKTRGEVGGRGGRKADK